MLCFAARPLESHQLVQGGFLINERKGLTIGAQPKPRVCALDWDDPGFQKMDQGEKLYVLGHGNRTSIGGDGPTTQSWDADAMAKKLADKDKGVPDHIKSIKLMSCNSGEGSLTGSNEAFCVTLARKIYEYSQGKIKVQISATTGSNVLARTPKTGKSSLVLRSISDDEKFDEKRSLFLQELLAKSPQDHDALMNQQEFDINVIEKNYPGDTEKSILDAIAFCYEKYKAVYELGMKFTTSDVLMPKNTSRLRVKHDGTDVRQIV